MSMNDFNISAPHFDQLLRRAKAQPVVVKDNDKQVLMKIYEQMKVLEENKDHDDYRHFWFYLDRGKIRDYGSFAEYRREGVVDTREDFKEMWLYDYPEKKHWYHFGTNEYNGEYFFSLDSDLTFHIAKEKPKYYGEIDNSELLNLLSDVVDKYCRWITEDNAGYNLFLNENLSYRRRLGKILRQKYWKINPYEKKVITKGLTKKDIAVLAKIVEQSAHEYPLQGLEEMTSGKFFECCRLGYDANNYFKKQPDISNIDAYRAYSDGRDEGLKEINPDSVEEYNHWFFDRGRGGGHPWEVCRGGNSTHISLYVHHNEKGWSFSLAGSASTRVNETVKFALALYRNQIPLKLFQAEEIYRMVTASDYIGIVPKEVFPRYCHSFFPSEDKIIDFMNLGWEGTETIIAETEWYPIEIKQKNK